MPESNATLTSCVCENCGSNITVLGDSSFHLHLPKRTPDSLFHQQELSRVAHKERSTIVDAANIKEALVRARAPQVAVWVLSEPAFLEDACHLLIGVVQLAPGVKNTNVGFDLYRRLQKHILRLSPTVVAVRCLRAGIGKSEVKIMTGRGIVRTEYRF